MAKDREQAGNGRIIEITNDKGETVKLQSIPERWQCNECYLNSNEMYNTVYNTENKGRCGTITGYKCNDIIWKWKNKEVVQMKE